MKQPTGVDRQSNPGSESKPVPFVLVYHPFAGGENVVLGTCKTRTGKYGGLTTARAGRTILEPALGIVRRALLTPAKILPFYLDVGALKLIPNHDLFWALDALALVVLTPHGRFRCANRRR